MRKLAQSVLHYIRENGLFCPGDRVGVAVSGGADSVALLHLMLDLRDELGIVLSVLHLNHKLRGAESEEDEQFARELTQKHGLDFDAESRDVRAYAAANKLGLEAAARKFRYDFFAEILRSRTDRVATAHTLDDQAETVLLKLSRGAGTRGLAGIYPELTISHQPSGKSGLDEAHSSVKHRFIVRPLLGTRKSQLREYLAEIGQGWREDATNQDLRHTRNRIRHEVLPKLEWELNPSFSEVLAEAAEISRAEENYWTAEVSRLLPQVWQHNEQDACLNWVALASFPLALRRRLVRAAANSLGLSLEFCHVEQILDLHKQSDRAMLPARWSVTRHHNQLLFRAFRTAAADYEYQLPVPGRVLVRGAGIEVEALEVSASGGPGGQKSPVLLDRRFKHGLVIRNWRAGERFWPAHSKAPQKIKELLQDRHITGEEKTRWPVIASGREVIWVRGFGVRRDFHAKEFVGILIRDSPLAEN